MASGTSERARGALAQFLTPFAGARALEVATDIVECFGTVAQAMNATAEELTKYGGDDRDLWTLLPLARDLVVDVAGEAATASPIDTRSTAFLSWLRVSFHGASHERLIAVYLDGRQRWLANAVLAEGGSNAVDLSGRQIFSRAMTLGASGVVLAHNHPSGDCRPSESDLKATSELDRIGRALDVRVIDHLIVSESAIYSFRAAGHLR